jgi:membrane protein required for beta-lactamase induction
MWNKTGGIALMQKYAVALLGYNVIWVIYSSVAGGKIGWLNLLSELAIGIITIGLIKTSEDIKAYLESLAQQ